MTEARTARKDGGWARIRENPESDDQQRDLHESYRAEIGPNAAPGQPRAWSWDIFEETGSPRGKVLRAGAYARDERAAKAAVAEWARTDLMVTEIARDTLAMAMAVHGRTRKAAAAAVIAVAASRAPELERDENN